MKTTQLLHSLGQSLWLDNITLLFSREHYLAAAEAFLRGIERRIAAGLNPQVGSVASIFISRWDAAVANKVPEALRNRLGIAIAGRAYQAYCDQLGSARWQRAYNAGARPQRLLWASTGTKDPFYFREGDRGWLLAAARVNSGPLIRRGCVGFMEEASPNHFRQVTGERRQFQTLKFSCWRSAAITN